MTGVAVTPRAGAFGSLTLDHMRSVQPSNGAAGTSYFPRSMLLRVKKTVENIEVHLLGAVLNNVDLRYDKSYRYYTSYNRYYTNQRIGKKQTAKAA